MSSQNEQKKEKEFGDQPMLLGLFVALVLSGGKEKREEEKKRRREEEEREREKKEEKISNYLKEKKISKRKINPF